MLTSCMYRYYDLRDYMGKGSGDETIYEKILEVSDKR